MKIRFAHYIGPLIGLMLFIAALCGAAPCADRLSLSGCYGLSESVVLPAIVRSAAGDRTQLPVAGLLSQIPGGLGVFESLALLLLHDRLPAADLLGALLTYRLIYYLLPLTLTAISLGGYELRHQKEQILWLPRVMGPWVPALLPHVFALLALISGAILLFSAATPGVETRLEWLGHFIPLSVLEISHLISSPMGAGLLLLARGIVSK